MQTNKLTQWVMMLVMLPACGADTFAGDDAGDGSDANPSLDASDDHKIGVKLDGGSDATNLPDASDSGSTTNDASDSGTATAGPRRIFTTAPNEYPIGTGTGKFQGLAGADAICQARATAAGLSGTWTAWLSSSTTSAAQRVAHLGSPYQLVDGTVVAYNWAQLTSGTLAHRIDENETSQVWISAAFWTSTSASGAALTSTCSDWTSNSSSAAVEYGNNSYSDSRWTDATQTTCADHMSFYCVEQ